MARGYLVFVPVMAFCMPCKDSNAVMSKVLFENGNKRTAKVIDRDHCTLKLTNATTTKGRAAGSYT